jgi:hypothetical protein
MRTALAPALPILSAGLFALFAVACSSGGGGTGTGTGNSTGSGTGSSGVGGSSGTGTTCPGDLAEAPGSAFCQGDPSTIECAQVPGGDHTQVCGVALPDPSKALARSANVMEFAGSGPPDLSCFTPAKYPTAGTSATVTMSGVARIFSHGCQSNELTIQVYPVKHTGGADDAMPGTQVGATVTTVMDCTADGVQSMVADCGTRYECKYTYPGVPTETDLVILTSGDLWAPLYEYNNYIPSSEVTNGTWSHDVRALASDDYSAIPQAAIGASIMPGNGAIAGEVHDCGNVRLSGATVDTNVYREGLTYFDSDEASPLPDTSASATSDLGLYAAFDLAPGPASVAALGLVDGKITTVGYYPARIFANAVTAVTFQGVRPWQVPASK